MMSLMFRTRFQARILILAMAALFITHASGQQTAKRIILKDGSYQLVAKYEVKGDRVRYLSAERNEWEELPNSLIDWPATEKFEKDRAAGSPVPEALGHESAEDRAAEDAKLPQVAPGLRVPSDVGIVLLDTFHGQAQLVELQQSGGELSENAKRGIFRAAVGGAKQTVELKGLHAKIQAHASLPSIYVNPEQGEDQNGAAPGLAWDRFHIVRLQPKQDRRIIGEVKVSASGKVNQGQNSVETTAEKLTGGWVKVTPKTDLAPGEYAVVEVLGTEGTNSYVWDFGVDPNAAENAGAIKPEAPAAK
jgi:hypothetical protein